MKFFLDIVSVLEIKWISEFGLVDGVIINLIIIVKEGWLFEEVIKEICFIVDGLVSVEVIGFEVDKMVEEVWILVKWVLNVVVKIFMMEEGLKVVYIFIVEGIKINVMFIFIVF